MTDVLTDRFAFPLELLKVVPEIDHDGNVVAASWTLDGETVVDAHVWQSNDWGTLHADGGPDVTQLAMIAVYPRPDEQAALAELGDQDAEKLHVTLVFLGEIGSFDVGTVKNALGEVSANFPPIDGQVGGVGRFRAGDDGTPIIALPSVRGLAELRGAVAGLLAMRGVESPSEHGWTPHLTLRYAQAGDEGLPAVPDVPLHFDSISYVEADVRTDFPLEALLDETATPDS